MIRSAVVRNAAAVRLFSTSTRRAKGPVEMAKDGLKTVDRAVSDVAVKGIDAGEAAASSIKSTVNQATGKAQEYKGQASGKMNEMAGEAKGKQAELKGEAKAKASELEAEANKRSS